jgi:hypothetical protein
MKTSTKRLMLAIGSSLLLLVGFTRAAEKMDPLSLKVGSKVEAGSIGVRKPCSIPCFED